MKANEAPEKLYIDFRDRAESTWRCAYTEKAMANDIEYIRTDAFIEKACDWLKAHSPFVNDDILDVWLDNFKKVMKGE